MSFLSMNTQRRVEALTSGVNSTGLKAATLYAMQRDRLYTPKELDQAVLGFLGQRYASKNGPYKYCMQSLEPAGMVIGTVVGDMALAFRKTEDASTFGNPSTTRLLYVASQLDISMKRLIGASNTKGTIKHGYAVAEIMALLRKGGTLREIDIEVMTGLHHMVVSRTLASLKRTHLISYDNTSPHHTAAKITPQGILAFDYAYGPIINISIEPESGRIQEEFKGLMRGVNVRNLFDQEMQRYAAEKRPGGMGRRITSDRVVYGAILSLRVGGEEITFRQRDILEAIGDTNMSERTVRRSLRRLEEEGHIEIVENGWQPRYRAKTNSISVGA